MSYLLHICLHRAKLFFSSKGIWKHYQKQDSPYRSGEVLQLQLTFTAGIQIPAFLAFRPNYSHMLIIPVPLLIRAQGSLPLI